MKKEKTERKTTKGEKTKQKLFSSAAKLFSQYDFDEVYSISRLRFKGTSTLVLSITAGRNS